MNIIIPLAIGVTTYVASRDVVTFLWLRSLSEGQGLIMAQQDDIMAGLDALTVDVDASIAHTNELEAEVAALQGQQYPDLSGVLGKIAAIRSKFENVKDSISTTTSTTTDAGSNAVTDAGAEQPAPAAAESDGSAS